MKSGVRGGEGTNQRPFYTVLLSFQVPKAKIAVNLIISISLLFTYGQTHSYMTSKWSLQTDLLSRNL